MKRRLLVLLVFLIPGFAHAESWGVVYLEKRGGEGREIEARVEGETVLFDRRSGTFPDDLRDAMPWIFFGLPSLEPAVSFALEGFPPLPLRREFEPQGSVSVLDGTYEKYRQHLLLQAAAEIIPLGEEEVLLNEKLKPFGVSDAVLEGEGEVWIDAESRSVVAEQFVLSGEVVRNGKKEHWQMEWARGKRE